MALNKILPVGIILILLIPAGCVKKDDLTLPVKVLFKIGILENSSSSNEYLDFTGCWIGIDNIRFEGTREAGGNFFFETSPGMNLQTLSFSEEPATISTFDLPQGIYNDMRWDISMKCIEPGQSVVSRDALSPCIGIMLTGNYMYLDGSVIPFLLAIDRPELFRVSSRDPDGNSTIFLSVDKDYEAVVWFSPEKSLGSVNRNSFETAKVSGGISNPEIVISSSVNCDLYQILLYRFFLSASVVVK